VQNVARPRLRGILERLGALSCRPGPHTCQERHPVAEMTIRVVIEVVVGFETSAVHRKRGEDEGCEADYKLVLAQRAPRLLSSNRGLL
jgi:hypothetical protein